MKNENSSCPLKNMSSEMKIAYFLIIILFAMCIFIWIKTGRADSGKKIAKWVDENPKAIIDSVQRFAEQQQIESQKKHQEKVDKGVKENMGKIMSEENTGVHNPKGKKVIVEFYDYNCGYCKMASAAIAKVIKDDKDVKVIFKDLPIFGGISELAAKYSVAIAIAEPNKFFAFHEALMEGDAHGEDGIKEAVKKAKINLDKILKTMKSKSDIIEKRIVENKQLANDIGIQGTPALMIGDEFIPGYVDAETMKIKLR